MPKLSENRTSSVCVSSGCRGKPSHIDERARAILAGFDLLGGNQPEHVTLADRQISVGIAARGARAAVRKAGALMISLVMVLGVSVISSTAKAEYDASRFTYVQLHCTLDNQSHFTDVTIELAKENFAPPAAPIAIGGMPEIDVGGGKE
jgi:hypothetical protein